MEYCKKINNNSNKAIIYSHAFASNSKTWTSMVTKFNGYNHYLIDFRRPKNEHQSPPTFSEYLGVLKDIIKTAEETELILVGSSMGGGLSICLFNEPKVKKIILLSPMNPWNTTKLEDVERSFFPQTIEDIDFGWKTLIYNWEGIVSSPFYLRSREKNLALQKSEEWWKRSLMKDNHTPSTHKLMSDCYNKCDIPVLLICGKNDKIISKQSFEKIKDSNDKIEWHLIDECGHAPLHEHKTQTLKLIEEFIK